MAVRFCVSVIGGVAAVWLLAGCRAPKDLNLTAEFDQARRNNIVVIDGRRAVDPSGARSLVEPLWAVNTIPGSPAPRTPHELALPAKSKVVVIFLHGYNVTAAESLAEGVALWQHIRKSNENLRLKLPALPETDSITFLEFLWRGDFGRLWFSEARQAAEITSRAFADFLRTVLRNARGARTVILTHSLGAEVALEALRAMENSEPVIDNLILVQAAIPAYSVYRWTVSYQQIPIGPREQMRPEQVDQCTGRYADAIRMARQLVYTVSAEDEVLGNEWEFGPFQLNEKVIPFPWRCELPVMPTAGGTVLRVTALGRPFDTSDRSEMLSPPKIPDPMERQRPPGYRPIPLLPPGETFFRYTNFRIDHPSPNRRDIASAKDRITSRYPGHSVLFQQSGQPVVEELWTLAAESWR